MRNMFVSRTGAGVAFALCASLLGAALPSAATRAASPARHLKSQALSLAGADKMPIPAIITAGPDRNLWFTNTRGTIDRVTPAGVMVEFPLPHADGSPVGIAAGSDGNLWFTEADGNRIGRITPAGVVTEYPLPSAGSAPGYIATGPGKSMCFTETALNKVGCISAAGRIREFTVPTPRSKPGGIVTGPDGNVWFAEFTSKKLGRMTPSGTFTEFALPPGSGAPAFVGTGSDGAIWFTAGGDLSDTSGHPAIGRITQSGRITLFPQPKGSHPAGITSGPDGNLWVADSGGAILRVTTAGKSTPFPLKQTGSAALLPLAITAGPDGNLWFTAPALCFTGTCWSQIGRITTAGAISEFSMQHARHA